MKKVDLKAAGLALVAAFGVTASTLLVTAAPADAREAKPMSRVVNHRDLDLGTEAGRVALQKRVARAADRVCIDPRQPSPALRLARRDCVAAAIEAAGPRIESAVLRDAAAHATRQATTVVPPPGS